MARCIAHGEQKQRSAYVMRADLISPFNTSVIFVQFCECDGVRKGVVVFQNRCYA